MAKPRLAPTLVLALWLAAPLACTNVSAPRLSTEGVAGNFGCAGNACCASGYAACGTACVDLQTDGQNCGACGHDCLPGGGCLRGQCLPAMVLETRRQPVVFGLDPSHVYFFERDTDNAPADVFRVDKRATVGTAATVVTALSNATLIGVAGSLLLWNESAHGAPQRGVTCDLGDCAATVAYPFGSDGELVPFSTPDPVSIPVRSVDTVTGTLRLAWYTATGTKAVRAASEVVPLPAQATAYGFFASGDGVYWGSWPPEGAEVPVGSVYGKRPSPDPQRPARLAGGLDVQSFIIDVSPQSVLVLDFADYRLGRIPLPLGLGAGTPQRLTSATVRVRTATEDANVVYWFDSEGTLYRCVPADCTATQSVLANGQRLGTNRLYQDASALYWGTNEPYRIMRLAK